MKDKEAFWSVATVVGSALWWWPVIIEPNLDLPGLLPLALVALWTGLATVLSGGLWRRFVVASAVGTFGGLWSGYAIWPPTDGIFASVLPLLVALTTFAAVLVSLITGLAGRNVSASNENRRRALWLILTCCFAFRPIALALTPPLVGHRVKRNNCLAAERFGALRNAVGETLAEAGDPDRICDGLALKRHYSGLPFSEENWRRITGNYVKQDGYFFMVYCREKAGYTINAIPDRGKADGTRHFCTDESRRMACGMEWNLSRNACVPCKK